MHTPGPWIAEGAMIVARDCYGPFIADCDQFNKTQDPKRRVTTEEMRANTALISSAPDLLASLEKAVEHYGKPGGPWNVPSEPGTWIADARAAIAKAKGEG